MQHCAQKYGSYGPVFAAMFAAATSPTPLGNLLTLTSHDVVSDKAGESYPALDEIDAILMTGSKFSAYEQLPWIHRLIEYVRTVLATQGRIKVIGVCFGHQIVSAALGLPVRAAPAGWEVSVVPIKLTARGQEVFFSRKPARDSEETGGEGARDPEAPLRLQQMHRDEVVGLPEGAEPLGATDKCVTQGFILPGRVLTVQGHPEFTEEIVTEILEARHQAKIFGDDVFRSGMERVGKAHDGIEVARAFLRFLRE
jgi:GMP synthase-like glutamine amidotransferase